MSVLFVVDMSHLKEDFLPFLTISFFVQVSIQIVKQRRLVKTLYLCKQAFINLIQQRLLIAITQHFFQHSAFQQGL